MEIGFAVTRNRCRPLRNPMKELAPRISTGRTLTDWDLQLASLHGDLYRRQHLGYSGAPPKTAISAKCQLSAALSRCSIHRAACGVQHYTRSLTVVHRAQHLRKFRIKGTEDQILDRFFTVAVNVLRPVDSDDPRTQVLINCRGTE
jgi:hypothetical protein